MPACRSHDPSTRHPSPFKGLVLLLVLHIRRLRRHGRLPPLEQSSGELPRLVRCLTERRAQPIPASHQVAPSGRLSAQTTTQGPCQRFARNHATRILTLPHVPTLGSAFPSAQ